MKSNGAPGTWAAWWGVACLAEAGVGYLVVRYAGRAYAYLDRYLLQPVLIHPIDAGLRAITAGYSRMLRWSLRRPAVVLAGGGAIVLVAVGMLYFDVLGQELIPSEDQSRFVVHVVCPIGFVEW